MRCLRPSAATHKISLHRWERLSSSSGTKGVGETWRVRRVVVSGRSKDMRHTSGPLPGNVKVFIRRRSAESLSTSISLTVSPVANRRSASSVPFSAMRLWPVNTRSVVDSPSPALAYT